jgi:hypothetical protein
MVFSVVIIVLIAVIGYFHYVQGLLSSVISLVCALMAAMLTLSYHEKVVALAFAQKMTDQGHALTLAGMFLIIYLVLRIIFDSLVPGNIRFPAIADKVGGALLGLIAGMFAVGIFAIAAQTLPFGPSIAGYGRYKMESQRDVKIPTQRGPFEDSATFDELKSETIKDEDADAMLVPADDFVIGAMKKFSDGGALEGERTFTSIHPAYIDEMFFNRLGIQPGTRHVIVNTEKQDMFKVETIYSADGLNRTEAEIAEIRPAPKDSKPVKANPQQALIVVRATFADSATDSDHLVRLAPAAVRLVANSKNFIPIGTMENGGLFASKPDDYMFVKPSEPLYFVFLVPREDVLTRSAAAPTKPGEKSAAPAGGVIKDGVFVEAKRMARVDLSGMPVTAGVPVEPSSAVVRKEKLTRPEPYAGGTVVSSPTASTPAAGATGAAPQAAPSGAMPIKFVGAEAQAKLFSEINVGAHGAESPDLKFKSGSASIKESKITKLELHAVDALEELAKGDDKVSELLAPSGTHIVQVTADASAEPWQWAEQLADFEVVDASGIGYKPNGAFAKVTKDGKEYAVGKFDADEPPTKIEKEEGTPTRITIIFLIPDNTPLKALNFKGAKVADVDLK